MTARPIATFLRGAVIALLLLLSPGGALHAGNVEVISVGINVSDLERARRFYVDVLDFSSSSEMRGDLRDTASLRLGEEILVLVDPKAPSRPVPADMPANDRLFQHIAIVVSDMDAAHRRLREHRVTLVSDGPQTLPDWNFDAAGIRALYFRDPDGHFLELIQFPRAFGEPKWRRRDGRLFLGIDHTAVVVDDTPASVRFYRDRLGLTVVGRSLNYGPEQDALNGVRGSRVRITALRGARGPGIELLQYERPGIAKTHPGNPALSDLLHWQIDLSTSRHPIGLHRDPDGHALSVVPPSDHAALALMMEALRQHWPRYLMEGAQLGIFMIVTLMLTLALEHPGSPIRRALPSALARRAIMGTGIGVTVAILIYSDWGRQSGAHFNPAVTLAFLSLDRIEPWDALFYVIAQFLGGWLGLAAAVLPLRRAAAHEKVSYVVTQPGPQGTLVAFGAELVISFTILFSLLLAISQPAWKPWIGYIAGLHLWAFIVFESPLSGMSLNPARTLASAIPARSFRALWVYFVAPPLGMLLAAYLCRRWIES